VKREHLSISGIIELEIGNQASSGVATSSSSCLRLKRLISQLSNFLDT